MKTITKIIFASTLAVVAPTFANAAYLQSHAAYPQTADQVVVTSKAAKNVPATRSVRWLDAMANAPADAGEIYPRDFGIGAYR
jgi:hypothetical protein